MRGIVGNSDQRNKERNFWEQGNSVKLNFGEHLNLFLRNKGTTVNFYREQGNMHPPLGGPHFHNGSQMRPQSIVCRLRVFKDH